MELQAERVLRERSTPTPTGDDSPGRGGAGPARHHPQPGGELTQLQASQVTTQICSGCFRSSVGPCAKSEVVVSYYENGLALSPDKNIINVFQ